MHLNPLKNLILFFFFSLVILPASVFSAGLWEISAHRGDRGAYRENSISALLHAMDIGAHSVEFDVHVTKDGYPIIYHDYKLNPADFVGIIEPVLIKDLTLHEIQSIRYSDRLVTRADDTHLVTLEEFLTAVHKREQSGKPTIPLHLEIKSEKEFLSDSAPVEVLAAEISKIINKVKLKTPIIARAFNWDALTEFRKHQPKIPLVLLVDKGDWSKIDFTETIRNFKPIAFAPNHTDLTAESIRYLVNLGIDVNPWTVNSPEVADELVRMGVTGITTDTPSVFLNRYRTMLNSQTCLHYYK